jgi:hypothetical protein
VLGGIISTYRCSIRTHAEEVTVFETAQRALEATGNSVPKNSQNHMRLGHSHGGIKITVFWDVTSCSSVHRFLRIVGTCVPN